MSVGDFLKSVIYRLFFVFPIEPRKVFLTSYYGKGYGDSPRCIADELRNHGYIMYWSIYGTEEAVFPEYIHPLRKNGLSWLYHMATAGVWIDNCRKQRWIIKRRKQLYIQTWHGGVCLKKVENDAASKLSDKYVTAAIHDSEMIDVFISGSSFQTKLIRRSFWYNGEIIETGLPRSDLFYKDCHETKKKVFNHFDIDESNGIILYAPTFRNNNDSSVYCIDYDRIIEACKRKWGGTWVFVVRLHPNISQQDRGVKFSSSIIDGSNYPDSSELICAASIIITDYSSVMFEALESKKITFLFAVDLGTYKDERDGFYFKFDELPFEMAESNAELCNIIENFNRDLYTAQTDKFIRDIGYYNDGHASSRVAEYIMNKTDGYAY